MFIRSLTIKNLRCFADETIGVFSVPDGTTSGTGLNILIGENGSGKTTVLEAISFLTQSTYSTNNTMDISDFRDMEQEIIVSYVSNTNFKCKMPPTYNGSYYEANGITFIAKPRDRKAPGKLLSPPFQVGANFNNVTTNYTNPSGAVSTKPITDYARMFSAENIDGDELSIHYFDKNRTRQLTQGNYKTTFQRICDDLNWRFIKAINDDATKKQALVDSLTGDYFQQAKETAQSNAGQKVANDLAAFLENEKYKNLRLDIINYLQPFGTGMLALRDDASLLQILSKDLGSGIEMIIALLMLRNIGNASRGKIIYLIDEPEAHLHPKAQKELLRLLLEESKDKQIFLSTHSPYIFKDAITKSPGLFLFKRDDHDEVVVTDARDSSFGHFPWSPSWGEVNFSAYDLPTVELHNELYGYIQEQTKKFKEPDLENYLTSKGVSRSKSWIKVLGGTPQPAYNTTLYTYIRNKIHHPENTQNADYTDAELRQSISEMLALIDAGL
ncbi:hypothetical protein EOL96_06185 [Candidatus Saccharibacteria bacterium]|nr:hypothetical protein [Candidatus Saccharibacteria bacterium]